MSAATPAFDHRDDPTPAATWRPAIDALPAVDGAGAHDHLLVLVAHPDDESLGAGTLIADAAAAGAQITVVVATDGEASHPRSPTHTPGDLAALRRAELHRALEELAPRARIVLLGLPDGHLAQDASTLAAAVGAVIDGNGDGTMNTDDAPTVVVAPWRGDGHPDHQACGELATAIAERVGARLLEFPVWAWHWGRPGARGPLQGPGWGARTGSDRGRAAKARALDAHVSQHRALSARPGDEPVLSPALLAHFRDVPEVFRVGDRQDLPRRYFDRLYRRTSDPWGLGHSFYETRKRDLLTAALPRPRFARAFEPGCAMGLTTAVLAERCDSLLAWDVSASAVRAARARVARNRTVTVEQGAVPEQWPDARFDLIVISELGYYLARPQRLAERVRASLTADGVLVAVHWRHPAPGYPSDASSVHAALGEDLCPVVSHVERDFLLDVWSWTGESVARSDGVLS